MNGLEPAEVSPTSPRPAVREAGLYIVARVRATNQKVVLMEEPIKVEAAADPDRWLTVAQVAELVGVQPGSWRTMVARGQAPEADDLDEGRPVNRRSPRWRASTVATFQAGRKGRGFRSDLRKTR